jgi:hypothetical protein
MFSSISKMSSWRPLYIIHVVETASLNSQKINLSLICTFGADAAQYLQLQVPWEVDNTVCSSDDVTIVDQRSTAAVEQRARAGTCDKQDRRVSGACVEMLSLQADTNADPGLIEALGGCSNRHLHTVTSVWHRSRSPLILCRKGARGWALASFPSYGAAGWTSSLRNQERKC